MRSALIFLLVATALAISIIEGAAYVASHRQDFPWTELDLDAPIGSATAGKLAALSDDTSQCRALLADVGDADQPVPPLRSGPSCGYSNGMRLTPNSAGSIRFQPQGPVTSCPMAAALLLWERDIVQPAATRHFGQPLSASFMRAVTAVAASTAARRANIASMRAPTRSTCWVSSWPMAKR